MENSEEQSRAEAKWSITYVALFPEEKILKRVAVVFIYEDYDMRVIFVTVDAMKLPLHYPVFPLNQPAWSFGIQDVSDLKSLKPL